MGSSDNVVFGCVWFPVSENCF